MFGGGTWDDSKDPGRKRRRQSLNPLAAPVGSGALSRRITRLSKSLKVSNPTHMYPITIGTAGAVACTPSTSANTYIPASYVAQGDDYFHRFAAHIDIRRICIRACFAPGTTSTTVTTIRVVIYRAIAGGSGSYDMNATYSPVADSSTTRTYLDRYLQVGATGGTAGFPSMFSVNLKVRHRQKFSGTGVNTQTGETIYIGIFADKPAGTTAPICTAGIIELWFKP